MRRRNISYTKFFLTGLLLALGSCLFAQLLPPPMYYVTVDPETGNDVIYWNASPSPEIDYYIIGVRVLTTPGDPDSYLPVGLVYIPGLVFVNTNPESATHSVGYTVWGINDQGGGVIEQGPFEHTDSTIFLQSVFDSCQATITLTWNDYNSWRGTTSNFTIKRRLGFNNYQPIASVGYSGTTNTYVISNVQVNQQYDLFVEAAHQDGIRVSASNRVGVFTRMAEQPDYINADFATINASNTIDLSFTVDPASGLSRFNLLRGTTFTGPFDKIAEINTNTNLITYTDNVQFRSAIYYYRLEALNNCGVGVAQSNRANNIILNGNLNDALVTLSWNEYFDWAGGVDHYSIIRTRGQDNAIVTILDAGSATSLTDNILSLEDYQNPSSSLVCYQVEATERMNVYNVQGRSLSNRVCFSITPDIRMPSAFIPNDADPLNQVFEPVFSFQPEHYEITIYNRLGTLIWQGTQPWDGRVNGNYVPEGVYVYHLRVYNYSTETTELDGQVTVVYR